MRVAAYEHLAELRAALADDHYVFAAGDFNTTSSESEQQNMLERFVNPHWIAVHTLSCNDCKGTNYYARNDSWSFLDMILWSPRRGEKSNWAVDPDSVRIANRYPAQVTTEGTPARFRLEDRSGVSDHWPLVMTIEHQPRK
jgi:endonuclease/exonuclease/phosphatase family metal-dependent hydrolase